MAKYTDISTNTRELSDQGICLDDLDGVSIMSDAARDAVERVVLPDIQTTVMMHRRTEET